MMNDQIVKKDLPNATATLVLGIISVVMCGVGLITGIIALVISKKDMALIEENPDEYREGSISNLKTGRVCSIIGICLSALIILFYIAYFGFIISMIAGSAGMQKML